MTNRSHPPVASQETVEELSQAAFAVEGDSDDPLDVVTALTPMPESTSDIVLHIDQDEVVYALHMAGHTPSQIAHNMTIQTKERWDLMKVEGCIERVGKANVARTSRQMAMAAQLELDRMDEVLRGLWPQAKDGNLQAIDRFQRLSTERRKMLGLDAPDVRLQLTLGSQEAIDFSALTTEELQQYQALQRKATSAARQKVVKGRMIDSDDEE